jgi:prephenate dehydrogenase
MTNPIIAIIGGTGEMGQWFKRYFERNNHKVIISSRKTEIKPIDAAKQADVVIISVPINVTEDVIKQVGPYVREDALLMDFTSIKIQPVEAMLKYSKSEVIGTHPVFGPSVDSLKNQTVVICPARGEKWLPWLKKILRKGEAKLKISTAEYHDKMMSVIQGMIHFSSIVACHTLGDMGIDINDSQKFSSPIYKLRLDVMGRILNQDPSLYADIEMLNPNTLKVLDSYIDAAKKLREIILNKDKSAFEHFFKEAADHLGDFKEEAEEYSDYLIRKLVRKE